MRILLVDDDEALMETLAASLIKQRYAVDIAVDGEVAREFLELFQYDLIVLDILLPDIGGITLCQQLRQRGITGPILMLTARDDSANKVQALDAGADDYVVKPFDFDELCARIRALLRRDSIAGAASILRWGDLSLKPSTFEIFYDDHQIHATPKEYALLELFMRHPQQVFSLDAIIENIWSFEDPPGSDAVRTHIKGVRQKLKASGAPKDLIETVYGLGYRLKPIDPASSPMPDPSVAAIPQPDQAAIVAAMAQTWDKHQDTMHERLSILEAAVVALDENRFNSDLQKSGCAQAHKLAGSLGCFGFAEGSRLARELELLLQLDGPLSNQHASQVAALVCSLRQSLRHRSSDQVISETLTSVPQLLVVGADEDYIQTLTAVAITVGIRILAVTNWQDALLALGHEALIAGALWIHDDTPEVDTTLLAAIAQQQETFPVLIMTDMQDFHHRLQIVQQGATRILPTSTTPQHLIEVIQHALQANQAVFRIIILDDDSQVLEFLRTILLPWGFQLTTLNHPSQLWSALETVQPHLLILDIEMPEANGLDLCRVLRADETWRQLPILMLTVHEDAVTEQAAFDAGADDFISKPVVATDLANRILNRLQRSLP